MTVTYIQENETVSDTIAVLLEQAAELECLLPRLARYLNALDSESQLLDLTPLQWRVCLLLEKEPLTLSAVGKELNIRVSAVTQIADRLEKVDMLERTSAQIDRRSKHLQLTTTGVERVRRRREARRTRARLAMNRLSYETRYQILAALKTLLSVMNESVGL